MAPVVTQTHSHRSTTKQTHKSFKSKFASKSALKERSKGKIDLGVRSTPHQQTLSKLARRNQAKQKRLTTHASHVRAASIFTGLNPAPRIVAVVGLSSDVSPAAAIRSLLAGVEAEEGVLVPETGCVKVNVERFKQNITWVPVSRDNGIFGVLDACRVADFVVLVLAANQEADTFGQEIIKCAESQGISNVLATAQGLEAIENPKKRSQAAASLKAYINHFFPAVEKVNSLESRQEALNVVRTLCTVLPKGVRWREDRSWMFAEEVRWLSPAGSGESQVVVTGVVRGKNLKADRLVQIGDWGAFQISKITAAPHEASRKGKGSAMAIDAEGQDAVLDQPTEDRDTLDELAPEEIVMEDVDNYTPSMATTNQKGVLLDDHHYFSDEETRLPDRQAKRIPKGTSKYQSAWYVEDVSDSGSDLEDITDDMEDFIADPGRADTVADVDMDAFTEGGPSDYPQSEAFLDPSPADEADQIAAYRNARNARKEEANDDLEFPDEIELPPNALARDRLAKYRGLKSLKTSAWNTEEDAAYEPSEWRRLLEIADYRGAKNRVLREALVGGVAPGTRVHVYLTGVPADLARTYNPAQPLALFSLLRHEHKHTAVNYSLNLSSSLTEPLRSKAELVVQCGPRRFVVNPLFSNADKTPNDVHKFNRYVHPGRSAMASWTGPLTWGSVPALYFVRSPETGTLTLVGTGTSLPPSHTRVIAKRVILTGHPYKIHKRVVTVRYMFFNAEDVAWFKALQLWTKRGRIGTVKESLGTHGYFKAAFDGPINPMDAVAVSLYKRVWPKQARVWRKEGEGGVPELVMG
ncbi:DUF663-domain-containing protein [Trichodelitschia bisporula]|uniref:DUF663-domain-containing protein n=1 Tax=Trichodelitschia bisporula TaxID=703511 RepID=A0A6G1I9K7_9PEZI|nr:DUF663-domain-containing protein [Trichodelitschia bisporula]